MLLSEQIKVVRKYIKFLEDNKSKWVASGRVSELDVNYDVECLKYVINSLIELDEFEKKLISRNKKYDK